MEIPDDFVPIAVAPRYFINRNGRVISTAMGRPRYMTPYRSSRGYMTVHLTHNRKNVSRRLHTLLLEAFVSERPTPKAHGRHLDGNQLNNDLRNLAWGTAKDNASDMIQHDRSNRGSLRHSAKLTPADVMKMRKMRQGGKTYKELADLFGVDPSTASRSVRGLKWAWLPEDLHFTCDQATGTEPVTQEKYHIPVDRSGEKHPLAILTKEIVAECRQRVAAGESCRALSSQFGVSPAAMQAAVKGRTWSTLTDPAPLGPLLRGGYRNRKPKPKAAQPHPS